MAGESSKAPGTSSTLSSQQIDDPYVAIKAALYDIEERARDRQHREEHRKGWWTAVNYIFGLPATGLAGVAGYTGFADLSPTAKAWGAAAAILAGALTAVATALNASREAERAQAVASQAEALATEAAHVRQIDLRAAELARLSDDSRPTAYEAARNALFQIVAQWNELNGAVPTSPVYPRDAIAAAARALGPGRKRSPRRSTGETEATKVRSNNTPPQW
jgi:hypothetical protein